MFDATKEDIPLPNNSNLEAKVLGKVVVLLVTVSDVENLATRSYLQVPSVFPEWLMNVFLILVL